MPLDLPPTRTFVIQVASDCDPELSAPRGRVEHVSSGRSARFESRDELWGVMRQILLEEELGKRTTERNGASR